MQKVILDSKTAAQARHEISRRWPDFDVNYTGFDKYGESVLISTVRRITSKAGVASARRNRSLRPVKFVADVPDSVECPHCKFGFHPAYIAQHIREKHDAR